MKYTIMSMSIKHGKNGYGTAVTSSRSYDDICRALHMDEFIEIMKLNKREMISSLDLKIFKTCKCEPAA